jgi:hypothetical protein
MNCLSVMALVLSLFIWGCWGPFDAYSPARIHNTVKRTAPGVYLIYYRWLAVQEEFGEDLDKALVAYMKDREILPQECRSLDIEVIAGQHGEGGAAWAKFRCVGGKSA